LKFFTALTRTFRLLAEEFFSLLIIAIVGAVLMVPIVTIPFVIGGYAAVADDLAERRPVDVGSWWRGAKAMWRPAYGWGLLNLVGWGLLGTAFFFYGGVEAGGSTLQGVVLVMSYLWYATLLYFLPIARLRPNAPWTQTLRNALFTLLTTPFDTFLLMLLLIFFAVPLLIANPLLLLFHPLLALLFTTVLVRLHLGRPASIEPEDLAD
jgi:hypothetical protein